MDPNQLPRALKESGHNFVIWYSIEALFNVMTIFNGLVMIMAFVRLHSLHIYFRTVCINVFAFAVLRSVIRVITFIVAFTTAAQMPLYYLTNLMLFVNIVLNFAQTSVVIERLRSCLAVNVYESLKSRKVICAFVILPPLLSFILVFSSLGVQVLPVFIFKWGSVIVNTTLWVWFYAFIKHNSWKNLKLRRSWKLNIRYQQKENLKLSVTMIWFGCYCSVQSLFVTSYTLWNTYDVRSIVYDMEGSLFMLADVVFNLFFTLSTALYPLPFIVTVEPIKVYYFKTFCCLTGLLTSKVNPVMIAEGCNNRDYHFQQLQDQWNGVNS